MVKSVGGEGQIAILSAMATAPNQNLWISFMEEALKSGAEKYPNLKGIIVPNVFL